MVGAAVAVPTIAASATSPWKWTTSQARKYAVAAAAQFEFQAGGLEFIADDPRSGATAGEGGTANPNVVTHCRGVGKRGANRYSPFRCSLKALKIQYGSQPVVVTKTLWIKIRRQGQGEFCSSIASLNAIPAACLNTSGTRSRKARRSDAENYIDDWLGTYYDVHPLPANEEVRHEVSYGYGAGYFEFTWWVVNQDNESVPLEQHGLRLLFTGKWKITGNEGCSGTGCPPVPGLVIRQTS